MSTLLRFPQDNLIGRAVVGDNLEGVRIGFETDGRGIREGMLIFATIN